MPRLRMMESAAGAFADAVRFFGQYVWYNEIAVPIGTSLFDSRTEIRLILV